MKIVLLPGLDGTGTLFDPFINALPADIDTQVISYPVDIKLTYEDLLTLVMQNLPTEDFILVGESFSGYIVYRVSLLRPNFLKSVVFVASFLDTPKPFLLGIVNLLPGRVLFSIPVPVLLAKTFLFGSRVNPDILRLFRRSLSSVSAEVLSFRLTQISGISESTARSQIPAIVIQPESDRLVSSSSVGKFRALFADIKVCPVAGPHFVLQANPGACAEIVLRAYASEQPV